ncbi:MAG: hypothetical protein NTX76_04945 [Alphaproteobacteria bacterium]|nr:hypothetical protein [Alphaproteobacteria bacterium]
MSFCFLDRFTARSFLLICFHCLCFQSANSFDAELAEQIPKPTSHKRLETIKEEDPTSLEPFMYESTLDKVAVLTPSVAMATNLLLNTAQVLDPIQMGQGFIAGFFMADALSGILHCAGDTFSGEDNEPSTATDVIKALSRGAYLHHSFPYRLAEMSYWEATRGANLCLIPVLMGASALGGGAGYVLGVTGVFLANHEVFHAIAHGKYKGNPLIKLLTDSKIILDKDHHQGHHQGYTQNFCVINGYIMDMILNPLAAIFRSWCGKRPTMQDD